MIGVLTNSTLPAVTPVCKRVTVLSNPDRIPIARDGYPLHERELTQLVEAQPHTLPTSRRELEVVS